MIDENACKRKKNDAILLILEDEMKLTIEIDERTMCLSITGIYVGKDNQMMVANEIFDTKRIAEMIAKEKVGKRKRKDGEKK